MIKMKDILYRRKGLKMKPKFKVGDKVKVIKGGYGCNPSTEIGKEVTIKETGIYYNDYVGYIVTPAIGNTKTGSYNGFIGEESFKLVKVTNWKRMLGK